MATGGLPVQRRLRRSLRRMAALATLACLCAGAVLADDQPPSAVKDEIFARKVLMDTIDAHMDAIDWMVTSNKPFDLGEAVERADTISVMLMTLPHLFPPQTNQWRPGDKRNPARDTFASPDLWKNFPDFYRRAAEASRIALDASRARSKAELAPRFQALRQACDSCHALYVKSGD